MSIVGDTISSRVKELRAARKLTLQEVADRAHTSKSYIWEIERGGSKKPSIDMAVSLAGALGVSLDYLTGLSTNQSPLHPEALRIACEVDALLRGQSSEVRR